MARDIGIIVIADGLGDDIRNRFKHCLTASNPRHSFDVKIMGSKVPRKAGVKFNKCKLLNKGLREMFKVGYKVIIQTDIDLICPPTLIDGTYEACMRDNRLGIHCVMRGLDIEEFQKYPKYAKYPWKQWVKRKAIYATGCWNGMQLEAWKTCKPFNDNMLEWGYEDRSHMEVSKLCGIKWKDIHRIPLMHINHTRRTKNVSLRNMEMHKKAKREKNFGSW